MSRDRDIRESLQCTIDRLTDMVDLVTVLGAAMNHWSQPEGAHVAQRLQEGLEEALDELTILQRRECKE